MHVKAEATSQEVAISTQIQLPHAWSSHTPVYELIHKSYRSSGFTQFSIWQKKLPHACTQLTRGHSTVKVAQTK